MRLSKEQGIRQLVNSCGTKKRKGENESEVNERRKEREGKRREGEMRMRSE